MATIDRVRDLLDETLGLGSRAAAMVAATPLLGNLPELDSMAVVEVVARIEADFGIKIYDDEISAETFATLGGLTAFIEGKRGITPGHSRLKAEFISGPRGDLFTLYFPPDPARADCGDLIFVPPFAEEMNRARATVAAQARAFARAGMGVLLLDLYGTGDSEGAFADARWETWRDDVRAARDWLSGHGRTRIGLWGLRLGGLLAADVLFDDPGAFVQLLLCEPVSSGKAYMDQFLRIGIAEGIERGGRSLSVSELRLKLSRTEPVEVAGYIVSRGLTHAVDRSDLVELAEALRLPVTWIDCAPPTAERMAAIDEVKRRGGPGIVHAVLRTPPFWALQTAAVDTGFASATAAAVMEHVHVR